MAKWVLVHPYLTCLNLWSQPLAISGCGLSLITRATALRSLHLRLAEGSNIEVADLTAMLSYAGWTLEKLHLHIPRELDFRLRDLLEGGPGDSLQFPRLEDFSLHMRSRHWWSEADLEVVLRRMSALRSLEYERHPGGVDRKDWVPPTVATMIRLLQRCRRGLSLGRGNTICRDEEEVTALLAALETPPQMTNITFVYGGPALPETEHLTKTTWGYQYYYYH